jgi:hypothetical protein
MYLKSCLRTACTSSRGQPACRMCRSHSGRVMVHRSEKSSQRDFFGSCKSLDSAAIRVFSSSSTNGAAPNVPVRRSDTEVSVAHLPYWGAIYGKARRARA